MTTISLVTVPILGQTHIPQALSKSLTFCASPLPFSRKEDHAAASKIKGKRGAKQREKSQLQSHLVCKGQTPTQNLETRSLPAKEIKM